MLESQNEQFLTLVWVFGLWQWMISFRANYSNQLTCIPFAVTNKALPVKGFAKEPHKQTHFSAILAHGC